MSVEKWTKHRKKIKDYKLLHFIELFGSTDVYKENEKRRKIKSQVRKQNKNSMEFS